MPHRLARSHLRVNQIVLTPFILPLRDVVANNFVTYHMNYTAFGQLLTTTPWYYGYTGREYDNNTALNYHRGRWLDPGIGRWISEDPIGFFGADANLNRYVGNAPQTFNDPGGLEWYSDDWHDWINPIAWTSWIGSGLGRGAHSAYGLFDPTGGELDQKIRDVNVKISQQHCNEFATLQNARMIPARGAAEDAARLAEASVEFTAAGMGGAFLRPGAPGLGRNKVAVTIRNSHLASKTHPVTGIPFDKHGFPDFSGVATHTVKVAQTGNRAVDELLANKAAGLKCTPEGYTWHHHQDGTTMQLVPRDIHSKTGHTGGVALK